MTNSIPRTTDGENLRKKLRHTLGLRISGQMLPLYESVWKPKAFSPKDSANNERLAFLGESVLSSVLTAYLYEKFPCMDPLSLEDLRNRISHHARLSRMAHRMKLAYRPDNNDEDALLLRDIVNSDILKALIGAITLTKGYRHAQKMIHAQLRQQEQTIREIGSDSPNYKGKLMAWGQRNKADIRFKVAKEIKYNGKSLHIVSLYINNEWVSNGCDTLVKNAEQHASLNALDSIRFHNDFPT
jgi:ribonuclease-3